MRRRLLRRVGVVAALLVAAVLLLHLLLAHALPVESVTRALSAELGFPVHVDAVAVRVLPSPRVRLRG
ncbi:MAG: hypothetical protein ACR2N6_09250, partial [Miltoncostaeaceae bacterium]